MKVLCFLHLVLWLVHGERKVKNMPSVDGLITSLGNEQWTDDEIPCLRNTLDILYGVKNDTLWATWVWDAMQPPAGVFYGTDNHFGNYDQCLQSWSSLVRLHMQYCLVDIQSKTVDESRPFNEFSSAEDYLTTRTKYHRDLSRLAYGVCLPAVCSPSSVAKVARHMHWLTYLPTGNFTVHHRDCQTAREVKAYQWSYYAFWSAIAFLTAFTLIATYCCHNSGQKCYTSIETVTQPFCIKRNLNNLFKVHKDDIKMLNGLRFLTACTVVSLHVSLFLFVTPTTNNMDVDKFMNTRFGLTFIHVDIVVDTFFLMSGLLLVRGLMNGNEINLFVMLLKRYIRLIGPFATVTFFYVAVMRYMGNGPRWPRDISQEVDFCEHWWKNLLMLNTDIDTICPAISWYVSCDYQLAVMATCLFFIFNRHRGLGITIFASAASAHMLYLGYVVYSKRLPVLSFDDPTMFSTLREHAILNETYLKSYSRAGSYQVGMALGYLISKFKPQDYRNAIGKNWSLVITLVSLVVMYEVMSLGYIYSGREYNALEVAAVAATNRVVWAVAVAFFICACEYGTVPVINKFLSWSGFVPLSKLSYGIYSVHTAFMMIDAASVRGAQKLVLYGIALKACGLLVISSLASLLLYLIVEAPLINISSKICTKKSITEEQKRNCRTEKKVK